MPLDRLGLEDDAPAGPPADADPAAGPFGHIDPEPEEGEEFEGERDGDDQSFESEETDPLAEPAAPEVSSELDTPPAGTEQEPSAGAPVDGQPEGQPAGTATLLAGRFQTPEALEQGYQEIRTLQDRTAQRARAAEHRSDQLEAYVQQLVQMIQQPAPQPAAPTGPPELSAELIAAAREQGLEPEQLRVVQLLAAQEAERRHAPLAAALERDRQIRQIQAEQSEQEATREEIAFAVDDFFARHTDVVRGSEEDGRITAAVHGLELDPSNPEALDIALEAARSPELYAVLETMPDLVETERGMQIARSLAGTSDTQPAPAAGTTPTAPAPPAPKLPHIEGGGGGLRPESADTDEWEVLRLARKERRTESPLGI